MPIGDALQGLVTLTAVAIGSLLAKNVFRRCNQPTVLGPIVFGLLIGAIVASCNSPSVRIVLPGTSKFLIESAGTAGLLLLMFAVGIELRTHHQPIEQRPRQWQLGAAAAFPIALCAAAAWPFAHQLTGAKGNTFSAWAFVGVALGVTAVPVLVLVIQDLKITPSSVARAAMRIAVITDGLAWALVTLLLILTAKHGTTSAAELGIGACLLAIAVLVSPRIINRYRMFEQNSPRAITMFTCALTGAASTQILGLHPAVGAIIAGYFFPAALANDGAKHVLQTVIDLLIPAFFVAAALSIPLQTLPEQLSWHGLVCLVSLTVAAFASKLLAGYAFGRIRGYSRRASCQLGVLLNCRGVTEIAIASVGYQAHLIGAYAFATLCALAILTTTVTAPPFRAFALRATPQRRQSNDRAPV
ncbi:cation:proton antiporter [Mycobacterium sp. MUNTM1]